MGISGFVCFFEGVSAGRHFRAGGEYLDVFVNTWQKIGLFGLHS